MKEHPDWNESYRDGNLPWDTSRPSSELQRVFSGSTIPPCRALELGCGTGTNSVWLAQQGFEVTGVDLAPLAVKRAKKPRSRRRGRRARISWSAMCFICRTWMAPLHSFSIAVVTMPCVEMRRSSTPWPWRSNWLLAAAA